MVWKKKEKELSKEEALKMAIADLKANWYNSEPLVAGVKENNIPSAHPLSPRFTENNWILLFWDPTAYSSLGALDMLLQWENRYGKGKLDFHPVSVIHGPYDDSMNAAAIKTILANYRIRFPLVIDPKKDLHHAFGVEQVPSCVFISQGKVLFTAHGEEIHGAFEEKLQNFYRKTDPGIPFSPVITRSKDFKEDKASINFGAAFKPKLVAWEKIPENHRNPELDWSKLPESSLVIRGVWTQKPQKICTQDPQAALYFRSPTPGISIIGCNDPTKVDLAKVVTEVNHSPVIDIYSGQDLQMDDEGNTHFILKELGLYQILSELGPQMRTIGLYFPSAKLNPVELYGLRFYE